MTRHRPLQQCTGCGSHRPAVQMISNATGQYCRGCVRAGRAASSSTVPSGTVVREDSWRRCRRCYGRMTVMVGGLADSPKDLDYCESCDSPPEAVWA